MKYIATGRVLPERADVRFGPIEWSYPDDGRVMASCDASQLTVVLDLKSIDGWATACIAADHYAFMAVGALGYSLGCGYSVEVIQVTEETGTPHVFGVRPTGETPEEVLGFAPHNQEFERAFRLVNQNVFIRLALRDYLRAITDPWDCPTYCYRVVESIKSAFVFKTGLDRWDDMHAALGTDRSTIDSTIKCYADPIRHGDWINAPVTDGRTRWKMLLLTRDILKKYMDHELLAT